MSDYVTEDGMKDALEKAAGKVLPLVIYDDQGKKRQVGDCVVDEDGLIEGALDVTLSEALKAGMVFGASIGPFKVYNENDPKLFEIGEKLVADNLKANPARPEPADLPFRARQEVVEYANNKFEITDGTNVTTDDVYVVWFAFVLGGWKALVSTTLPDGKYYEVTYNKDKRETYIDVYVKFDNVAIPDADG